MEKLKIPLPGIKTRHNSHDIETALAWNALKKTLHEAGRDDLFPYIQSVKVTEKYVTVRTGKPLINLELLTFEKAFSESLDRFFQKSQKVFRFI
ncbi:MAG: hypothetical protein HHAS10_00860 [Candidatus Altimarinota bacterium]